ncbi:uncharacterized protein LOC143900822 [Temnothorax americanus]|uniref:uncharacterized protein LOC143900822 n=1 Tax=Temnothorax americanus TaxID=1964332 RepID=UPI00406923D3
MTRQKFTGLRRSERDSPARPKERTKNIVWRKAMLSMSRLTREYIRWRKSIHALGLWYFGRRTRIVRNRDRSIVHALPRCIVSFLWKNCKKISTSPQALARAILEEGSLSKRPRYKKAPGYIIEDLREISSRKKRKSGRQIKAKETLCAQVQKCAIVRNRPADPPGIRFTLHFVASTVSCGCQ